MTCPTSAGSSPPSGCGWVTWRAPTPTWSGPSARSPRGIGQSDSATWLGLVRAELLDRQGDTAAAGEDLRLPAPAEEKHASWWFGVQVIIHARLAVIALADGDEARCRALLAAALQTATDGVELPPVADVIDAIAMLAQHSGERATAVATLLGTAHGVRG